MIVERDLSVFRSETSTPRGLLLPSPIREEETEDTSLTVPLR